MTRRLTGRTALVTGAGRGIGREVARTLAHEGCAVALVSRTAADLASLADELAGCEVPVLVAPCDVSDAAAVDAALGLVLGELGPVDLLVNGAARIETGERRFWEADRDELWAVVETNLRGPLLLCHALLPAMVDRGRGHVVNITSRARAATATGTYTGYAVSKRALTLLTEALAPPLRGTGVVVVDLLPGLVRTPMTESMAAWKDVPDDGWDPASASCEVVVDVALGRYDERSGQLLDAVALTGRRGG